MKIKKSINVLSLEYFQKHKDVTSDKLKNKKNKCWIIIQSTQYLAGKKDLLVQKQIVLLWHNLVCMLQLIFYLR